MEIVAKMGVYGLSSYGCLFNMYMKVWDVLVRMDVAKVFRLRRSEVFVMGNCGDVMCNILV